MFELTKHTPYLGLDAEGEHQLSYEAKETWLNSIEISGVLLDLTEERPHIYIGRINQPLSDTESMLIHELMCSEQPLTVQKIVDVVWEGSIQASSLKKSISRIRKKLITASKESKDVISTTPNGYLWNKKYPWKIIKINYLADVE